MTDGLHSPLGPSSFARAEACTASVVLGASMDPVPASPYALEGSAAHWVLETCLREGTDAWEMIGELYTDGEGAAEEDGEEPDDTAIMVDGEMADHVQRVIDFIRKIPERRDIVELEVRLDLPGTPIFGTCDTLIATKTPIRVIDFKYGAGIEVSADSVQTGMYGLMAVIRKGGEALLYEGRPDEVLVVVDICQPRSRVAQFKRKQWTRGELISLRGRITKTINAVRSGSVHYRVGDHCQFCARIATCPALAQTAKDVAMSRALADPSHEMTASELDLAYDLIPRLNLWISRVVGLAHRYLEEGGVLSNAKLVDKRPRRQWIDEAASEAWLNTHLGNPYQDPKLLSPAMAEKKLPKNLRPLMAEQVVKKSSGTTVVAHDDPRPAIDTKALALKNELARQAARHMIENATRNAKNGK